MDENQLERTEVELLLEAMYQRYGFDLRSYSRSSLDRRLRQFMTASKCSSIAELIPRALHDEVFFSELTHGVSVLTTEMFRDPSVHLALRLQVLPELRSWSRFKVWHAGCSTGEEVYSLAIALLEQDLLGRATRYATDINQKALARAEQGIYALDRVQKFTKSYQESGGLSSFSDYYHARYDSALMSARLGRGVTFANHNLAVDHVFGEMHLVVCRNVLIYFEPELQNRALKLFADSLVPGGFLCLGSAETLRFTDVEDLFCVVDASAKIYRKRHETS